MAFCDPPYNVNYANSAKRQARGKNRPILNDALGEGVRRSSSGCERQHARRHKGRDLHLHVVVRTRHAAKAFREAGGKWSTFVIWAKNTFTLGRADYQRQYEPILYGWKEGAEHFWCGARDQGDVWFFDKPAKNDLHPTMKPVALVERAIRTHQEPGHRARFVRRLGHDDDCGGADGAASPAAGARPSVCRCDRSAMGRSDRGQSPSHSSLVSHLISRSRRRLLCHFIG